jgi:hypothetical protein
MVNENHYEDCECEFCVPKPLTDEEKDNINKELIEEKFWD